MNQGTKLREKLSYSNVVSTFCLFLILGGGAAYAAAHLPKNSVGAKQLKKNAVTPPKVAASTIKLFSGQKGDQGIQGIPGPPGPTAGVAGGFNDPPATFDFAAAPSQTISFPSAGKLFAMGSIQSQVNCTSSGTQCTLELGLYVDGHPVAGTLREESAPATATSAIRDIDMFGVTGTLPAGPHTITIGIHKASAGGVDSEWNDSLGGFLLG